MNTFTVVKDIIKTLAKSGSGAIVLSYSLSAAKAQSNPLIRGAAYVGAATMSLMVSEKVGDYVDTYAEKILASMEAKKEEEKDYERARTA